MLHHIVNYTAERLVEQGYEAHGNEILMNGMTGLPFNARIFMGIGYYQRLKHLVADKIHVRGKGDVQMLTRQPCAGRSKEGGLRFGEMERDCIITHGASSFLKERLFDMSDPYDLEVCEKCGIPVNKSNTCPLCEHDKSRRVFIPYASKLMFQELQAMCLKIHIQ